MKNFILLPTYINLTSVVIITLAAPTIIISYQVPPTLLPPINLYPIHHYPTTILMERMDLLFPSGLPSILLQSGFLSATGFRFVPWSLRYTWPVHHNRLFLACAASSEKMQKQEWFSVPRRLHSSKFWHSQDQSWSHPSLCR